MATDITERVLFEVKLNAEQLKAESDNVRKKQQELATAITATRAEQKQLAQDLKAGTKSEQEYATAAQVLSEKLRGQTKEQAAAGKQLESLNRVSGEAEGSINQLRGELALTTAAYNALSKGERESSEAGKALQARTKAVSDELKAAEQAVGDYRREIGKSGAAAQSFGGALVEAAKGNEVLGVAIEKGTDLQQRYAQAQNLAKLAMGGSTGAAGVLRVALIALPIFAVVAVLGALYSWLTKTQEGMDFVERKTKGVSLVFSALTERAASLGKMLFEAFDNPKQAVSDLVDFIGNNLTNRLRGFVVLLEAIQSRDVGKLKDGFIQVATGVTDASAKLNDFTSNLGAAFKAGESIALQAQRIREAERALNVERDESRAKIEGLKKFSDDETKSIGARARAAKEAAAIEGKLLAAQLKLQDDKIRNLQTEQRIKNNLTAEDKDALADLRRERAQTDQESLTLQTELQNKINSLNKSAADTRKQLTEQAQASDLKRQQEQIALFQAELDARLRTAAAGSDEEFALQSQKLAKQRELELADRKLSADARKVVEIKYNSDMQALETAFAQQRAAKVAELAVGEVQARLKVLLKGGNEEIAAQKELVEKVRLQQLAGLQANLTAEERAAKKLAINNEAAAKTEEIVYQNRLSAIQAFYQKSRNELERAKAGGLLTEQEYQTALFQQEIGALAARIELNRGFNRDSAEQDQALTERKIQHLQTFTDKEREARQQQLDTALAFGAALGELFSATVADTGATLADFAAKTLLLVLDTLQKTIIAAQVKILAEALASPDSIATFGVAGFAKAALLIGATSAAFGAVKSALQADSAPRFADGGRVVGPGGPKDDLIPALLSNGEGVMNARSMQLFGPVLSWMNQAGGGKSFGYRDPMPAATMARYAEGGVVRYDASYMAALSGRSGGTQQIDYQALAQAIADKVVPGFYEANKALPVPDLNITELDTKRERVARNEARGTI